MHSRDAILDAIRQHRPPSTPLPEEPRFPRPEVDLAAHFSSMVIEVGGQVEAVARVSVATAIAAHYPEAQAIYSTAPAYEANTLLIGEDTDPHDLAPLDLFVCEGLLGVAESGAIWVPASRLVHRAAPFLAQHLVLLLDRAHLVWNLHEAYARLNVGEEPFGLFIAGPSKTADIEQALVIGAHGPRSLSVLLLSSS